MTLLEMTILGLIAENPGHAYQVEKIIEDRGIRRRMDIGFSTIYATLKKMEKKRFVESKFVSQEKLPGRRIYSITGKGQSIIKEELFKSISQPKNEATFFEVALAFSSSLTEAEIKEALSIYDGELSRLIQEKVKELTNMDTVDTLKQALKRRPLVLWQEERKWVRELIQYL